MRGYPGECRELHGHTWDVEVTVRGEDLDEVGIVYDFKDLKNDLGLVLEAYDHAYLNDVPPFDTLNPTAENLARVIYEALASPRVTGSASTRSCRVGVADRTNHVPRLSGRAGNRTSRAPRTEVLDPVKGRESLGVAPDRTPENASVPRNLARVVPSPQLPVSYP